MQRGMTKMETCRENRQKGFTLVELMVGIMILSIIMVGLLNMFDTITAGGLRSQNKVRAQESARRALEGMTREVMVANHFNAGTTNATSISFRGDVYNEDNWNQVVTYNLVNGVIYRNGFVFCNGVTTFDVTYFNELGQDITALVIAGNADALLEIKRLDITLTVTAAQGERYEMSATVSGSAAIRNVLI